MDDSDKDSLLDSSSDEDTEDPDTDMFERGPAKKRKKLETGRPLRKPRPQNNYESTKKIDKKTTKK